MIINPSQIEQRTDNWFKARLGKVTASKISDVLSNVQMLGLQQG